MLWWTALLVVPLVLYVLWYLGRRPPFVIGDDCSSPAALALNPHLTEQRRRNHSRLGTDGSLSAESAPTSHPSKGTPQVYDHFCVLDVEATCIAGQGLDWPNEIIEWPVVLLGWRNPDVRDELVVVDEWRSFVKPVYRPRLSDFCTALTGISQANVDSAPKFKAMLKQFRRFLRKHRLLDDNDRKLGRWTWCTDGPYDIRDFVTKQCFISAIPHPTYLQGEILDVRMAVSDFLNDTKSGPARRGRANGSTFGRPSLKIPNQLQALGLAPFEGRQHSGIDDTRNIARIVVELARRGVSLRCNLVVRPGRRWPWMGRTAGTVLEDKQQYLTPTSF